MIQDPRARIISEFWCAHRLDIADIMIYSFPASQDKLQTLRAASGEHREDLEKLTHPGRRCDVDVVPPMPRGRLGARRRDFHFGMGRSFSAFPTKAIVTTQAPPLDLESPFQYSDVLSRNQGLNNRRRDHGPRQHSQ